MMQEGEGVVTQQSSPSALETADGGDSQGQKDQNPNQGSVVSSEPSQASHTQPPQEEQSAPQPSSNEQKTPSQDEHEQRQSILTELDQLGVFTQDTQGSLKEFLTNTANLSELQAVLRSKKAEQQTAREEARRPEKEKTLEQEEQALYTEVRKYLEKKIILDKDKELHTQAEANIQQGYELLLQTQGQSADLATYLQQNAERYAQDVAAEKKRLFEEEINKRLAELKQKLSDEAFNELEGDELGLSGETKGQESSEAEKELKPENKVLKSAEKLTKLLLAKGMTWTSENWKQSDLQTLITFLFTSNYFSRELPTRSETQPGNKKPFSVSEFQNLAQRLSPTKDLKGGYNNFFDRIHTYAEGKFGVKPAGEWKTGEVGDQEVQKKALAVYEWFEKIVSQGSQEQLHEFLKSHEITGGMYTDDNIISPELLAHFRVVGQYSSEFSRVLGKSNKDSSTSSEAKG